MGPPALREAAAGGSAHRALRRLREVPVDVRRPTGPEGLLLLSQREWELLLPTHKQRGRLEPPALREAAHLRLLGDGRGVEEQNKTAGRRRGEGEGGGRRRGRAQTEIGDKAEERRGQVGRDGEVRRQDAGGDGQKARGRPHRGRVGITARLRRLVRRRQADDRPVAGPRRLLLPRSRPRMHALDRAQNHFHGAFDDLCRSPDSLVDLDAGIGSTRPSPWKTSSSSCARTSPSKQRKKMELL